MLPEQLMEMYYDSKDPDRQHLDPERLFAMQQFEARFHNTHEDQQIILLEQEIEKLRAAGGDEADKASLLFHLLKMKEKRWPATESEGMNEAAAS